jgi:hypothetical protein
MNPWSFFVVPAAFLAFLAWRWWRGRVRAGEVRALAATHGFHYLGEALPRSLDLAGSLLASASSVWNVIDGEPQGTKIVAFDCKIGEGRGSFRRTVVAVAAQAGISTVFSRFDPGLRQEQVKDWVLIYRPEDFSLIDMGLTPISELQAYLEAISN